MVSYTLNNLFFFVGLHVLLLCSLTVSAQKHTSVQAIKDLNKEAYFLKDTDPQKGLILNEKALRESGKFNDNNLLSLIYSARGVLYKQIENYDSASYYTLESLRLREEIGDDKEIAKSLNNLGSLYYECNQLDKAKKYYKQTLAIRLRLKDTLRLPLVYNNLGNVYKDLELIDSAFYFYKEGLTYTKGDYYGLQNIQLNLGILYNKVDNPKKALYHLNTVAEQLDVPEDNMLYNHNVAIAYEKLEQYDSSASYLNKTKQIADSLNDNKTNSYLSQSYLILKLKKENDSVGLRYLNEYTYYKNELTNELINADVAEVDAKYQTEKKDAQLKLATEKSKRMKAENDQNYIIIIALIALLVIIISMVFILIRFNAQKRKLTRLELDAKKQEIDQLIHGYELDLYEAQNFGQQAERARIATDLHDRLGGLLAAINLKIESLTPPQSATAQKQLDQIKGMLNDGITEVRNVSHNMRSDALKKHGLKGALESICASIVDSKKINIDLYLDDLADTTGSEEERELYKIIMELFSNTLRHSKADLITLQINQIDNELSVMYEDNGIGFDHTKKNTAGLGLSSIDSRIKTLNGRWQIDSQHNKGVTIIINIPL